MTRLLGLAAGALLLAGCNSDQAETRDIAGEREAEGEVLGGSISDEMIGLEQLRSQSRNLRAPPEPEPEEQEVDELFDAVVAGEVVVPDTGTPEVAEPPVPPVPEPAPTPEPAN